MNPIHTYKSTNTKTVNNRSPSIAVQLSRLQYNAYAFTCTDVYTISKKQTGKIVNLLYNLQNNPVFQGHVLLEKSVCITLDLHKALYSFMHFYSANHI